MKSFLYAAGIKLSKAIAADPVGTGSAILSAVTTAAPVVLPIGVIVGAGYLIYKAATE